MSASWEALYDGSDGLVGKIQTMWSVIATKQGYDGALALQASCYSNYYAALGATISTVGPSPCFNSKLGRICCETLDLAFFVDNRFANRSCERRYGDAI